MSDKLSLAQRDRGHYTFTSVVKPTGLIALCITPRFGEFEGLGRITKPMVYEFTREEAAGLIGCLDELVGDEAPQ